MAHYLKHKMRGKNPGVIAAMVLMGIIVIGGLAILFGFVILWLWNWLMPDLFGLPEITYWQGVGIFILAKILFGMGHGGGGGAHKKHHRQHKCHEKGGRDHSDWSKWKHYDKFWQEEGKAAFDAYVSREDGSNSSLTKPEAE